MAVNRDKPLDRWTLDIARSVAMYNDWFTRFAPEAYRAARVRAAREVEDTLLATRHLADVGPQVLKARPGVLPTLRMATCPPLAVDRLIGLAGVPRSLVEAMEQGELPARPSGARLDDELRRIAGVVARLADPDIVVWRARGDVPTAEERRRAATIVADRLCGAVAGSIIRNAQERRQLAVLGGWLEARGYRHLLAGEGTRLRSMPPGTFGFRLNVPVDRRQDDGTVRKVNVPVNVVVMPKAAQAGELPLLVETKSAGDFANVNKRRKEDAARASQLRHTYGAERVRYILFLCGYFDTGYLGYAAAEGIDWVWEHRIDDLAELGL